MPEAGGDGDRLWVDSMPAAYDRWLTPAVFRPFAVDLARRVSARQPQRVLEVAAGTGALTRELAAAAYDELIATDLNAAMVDFGRQCVPQATWEQADVMNLPYNAHRFDAVACQFGVMFFPDKVAAFAEVRRVLAPGGAIHFTTWSALAGHDFEAALVAALNSVFPHDAPRFFETGPHGYHDLDRVVNDVESAGFSFVDAQTLTLESRADSARDLAAGYCHGTPLRAHLAGRGDLTEVTEAITRELERILGTGEVRGRLTAHVIEAHSPR